MKLSSANHLEMERGHPADSSPASDWLRTSRFALVVWTYLDSSDKVGKQLFFFIRPLCNLLSSVRPPRSL